jgi:hypothetical protein
MDDAWKEAWRRWLRARFGDKLTGEAVEQTIAAAERTRAMGEVLARAPLDNGEMPFSNLLPPTEEPGP